MEQSRDISGNNQVEAGQPGLQGSRSTSDSAVGYPRDMTDALKTGSSETMANVGRTAQATWNKTKQEIAKRASQADELLREKTTQATDAMSSRGQQMLGYGRQACQATEKYARENTWTALGIVAAVGLLIGILIRRR
jgi:ElaB/YqjD/DUF883 family membrane-anchored ribosome-binding protein